ncbi:Pilus biogenesis CpaD protein [compost metagenome]
MSAVTEPCGNWPADLVNSATIENRNWQNFGCASQNNLAAQLENPMDLVAPRKMAPIDATQRANVIAVYRDAAKTTE